MAIPPNFKNKNKKKPDDATKDDSEDQENLSSKKKDDVEDDDKDQEHDEYDPDHDNDDDRPDSRNNPDKDDDDDMENDKDSDYDDDEDEGYNKKIMTNDKGTKKNQIVVNPPLHDVLEAILEMPEVMQEHALNKLLENYDMNEIEETFPEEFQEAYMMVEKELTSAKGAGEEGTDELVYNYITHTPGQNFVHKVKQYNQIINPEPSLVYAQMMRNFLNQKTR